MQCLNNLLLNTDSYKASHWLQYPPGTDATFFYVESRGGLYDRTLFYGLQAILKEYLAKPITHAVSMKPATSPRTRSPTRASKASAAA